MAQKIAPAALRLYTNKQFDASWFGDRVYGSLFHQTLQMKKFVMQIFESIGTKTALSHVQATPHTIFVQSFFCTPRAMNKKMRKKNVRLDAQTQYIHPFEAQITWQPKNMPQKLFALCLGTNSKNWMHFHQFSSMYMILVSNYAAKKKQYATSQFSDMQHFHMLAQCQHIDLEQTQQKKQSLKKVSKYASHIENVLAKYTQKKVVWTPYKMKHLFTSAAFVAHYIALQFEHNKKKPFRTIFQDVLKQCVKLPNLVGVRIAIAGRIGGAEMARVETTRYGQTSLHVFSHAIDYHATTAYTPHGLLGIKVWISFKNTLKQKR